MDMPSDSDDSIIFIPYVKPTPPLLIIDDIDAISIDGDKEEIAGPSQSHSSTNSYPVKNNLGNNNNASSSTTTKTTQDFIDPENSSLQNSSNQIQESVNYNNTVRSISNTNNSTSTTTPENNKKATGKSNKQFNNNNNRNDNKFYDIDTKGSHGLSTFPYTLTDSEKRTDLLYEKIVNVVQKQKLEKKLMLDRVNQSKHACLEQVKNLTKSRKSTADSPSSSNTTSPQKIQQSSIVSTATTSSSSSPKKKTTTRTKRKRDDSGNLSAAELDHYNFLKTLNLTANIGLDESEMLALGRNKTKNPRKKRAKKSNDIAENKNNNNMISHDEVQPVTSETTLQCKPNNDESNSVSESSDHLLQKQSDEKTLDIPLINLDPCPTTTTTTSSNTSASLPSINFKNKNDLDDATVVQFVSIIDESVGKSNNRKKVVKSSSGSLTNVSSSTSSLLTTIPSTSTTTPVTTKERKSTNNNNKKVPQEIVIISSDSDEDEEENHGIFTRQELDKLQSNIRLNISGGDGNKLLNNSSITARNSQYQESKSQEKLSAKKNFRYFQTTSTKATQQYQENDDESEIESDKESLHEISSCSSTSESRTSAKTNRTTSKSRFIKNKLKELKRKSSDKTPIKMSKQQQQKMPQSKRTKFDDDFVGNSKSCESGSDSSSSLLTRPMSFKKNRHKTVNDLESNLKNDSFTDRLFPATWTESMKAFYGRIRDENLDVEDVLSKQPDYRGFWAAPLDPDFTSNFRGGGRRVKCDNCQQWGHVKNRCPEPVKLPSCLMCGEEMHTTPCFYSNDQRSSKLNRTTPSRCPNTSCLNCGKSGANRKKQGSTSKFVQSCEMCSSISNHHGKTFKTCRNCNQHGHIASVCPEDWRRFHSTTTPDYKMEQILIPQNALLQQAQYKSRKEQYCSNCGKKNHMYFDCGASRDFNSYLPSTPHIINELPLCLKQSSAYANATMTSPIITTSNSNSTTVPIIIPGISNDLQDGVKTVITTTATTTTASNEEEKQSINEHSNQKSKLQQRRNSSSKNQTPEVLGKDSNNSINEAITPSISNSSCNCPNFPDCTNTNEKGITCHIINLSKEEYQLILKLNEKINVLTQLKTDDQACSVCLVEKSSSFHLYGNYDDLKDKIFQLLYKLKTEGVELYVETVLQGDKIINKETEDKVVKLQKVTSSTSNDVNPEVSSSPPPSSLQNKDEELSDPDNESDPVLFHKKTIINDNNSNLEQTQATVSNNTINDKTDNCDSVVGVSNILDESEIFIEPEIDIIMNRKITITNERALTSSSPQEKIYSTENINSGYVEDLLEPGFQQLNKDDTMVSNSVKNDDFGQIQLTSTTTTTTTRDKQEPLVREDYDINVKEQVGNQSSPVTPQSNVQNNTTVNSTLKEVPTATPSSSSNSCERNVSELPEIIHIDDDDDEADEDVIVEEVSRKKNKSPQQMERNHSKSPKRKDKTNDKNIIPNNNTNNRKSQEHVSPVATIKVNSAEWKQLLHMGSIEFLNSVRDEFNVQISAEKEKLTISISNNKWATLLNAKFKIHQWLLSKTYNNTTGATTERREQYPKHNNRHDNRSRSSSKNEEISPPSSSSSASSRINSTPKNHDKRREGPNRPRSYQHEPQNSRGNGRGTGRGFRGPRSFKNFNNRTQNSGY